MMVQQNQLIVTVSDLAKRIFNLSAVLWQFFLPVEKVMSGTSYEQHSIEEKNKVAILCKICQYPITTADHKISVQSYHQHIFVNPRGLVFEIGCFAVAQGCTIQGQATSEHTWFENFSWQYALCDNCYQHLGWFYQAPNSFTFYGLIVNRLIAGIS